MAKSVPASGQTNNTVRDVLKLGAIATDDPETAHALARLVGVALRQAVQDDVSAVAAQFSCTDEDVALVQRELERAVYLIAQHGDVAGGGARFARTFIRSCTRAAREHAARSNHLAQGEAILGALRSLCHATLLDGRSVYFPNHEAIARAVLGNNATTTKVAALAARLPATLAPFLTARGVWRPGAERAAAIAAIELAGLKDAKDVLDARAEMRKLRQLPETKQGTREIKKRASRGMSTRKKPGTHRR